MIIRRTALAVGLLIGGQLVASCGEPPPTQRVQLAIDGETAAEQWLEWSAPVPLQVFATSDVSGPCLVTVSPISITRSDRGRIVFQDASVASVDIAFELVDHSGDTLRVEAFVITRDSYCVEITPAHAARAPFSTVRIRTDRAIPYREVLWQSIYKTL